MSKNVLITGAAGGIGSAIALRFIENGFDVYSLDLCSKDLGEKFHNIHCDVTSKDNLHKVKEELKEIKFDHIITLAGRALEDEWKNFDAINFDSISKSVELKLIGHLSTI